MAETQDRENADATGLIERVGVDAPTRRGLLRNGTAPASGCGAADGSETCGHHR